MTNFLLIRHGNSEAVKYAPGRMPEVHLSEEGRFQAQRLAEKISHYKIDHIFSSPLDRTRETAEAIANKLNKKVEFLDNLLELELGDWTGKSFSELENIESWHNYHYLRTLTRIPGGEMFIEVQARMIMEIDRLTKMYQGKNIILVSHGDTIRSVISYFAGIPIDMTTKIVIDTASVSMISIKKRSANIVFINKWGFHLYEQDMISNDNL